MADNAKRRMAEVPSAAFLFHGSGTVRIAKKRKKLCAQCEIEIESIFEFVTDFVTGLCYNGVSTKKWGEWPHRTRQFDGTQESREGKGYDQF